MSQHPRKVVPLNEELKGDHLEPLGLTLSAAALVFASRQLHKVGNHTVAFALVFRNVAIAFSVFPFNEFYF